MKLSFVIPAHNEAQYLGPCLDSVINEINSSSCEAEIIVVDNASTDKTRAVAQSYKHVKIVDESTKGLTRARQAGFLASCGELIANIDADTRLPPGWINKVIAAFENNRKLAAFSGPQVYYDLPFYKNLFVRIFYLLTFWVYIVNCYVLRVGSVVQGGNFVVRRSSLEKIGGFNLDIDFYGEDTDIAKRLSPVGQVQFSLGLPIFASGRRLAKEGVLKMGARYAINYFWMIFFRKPFSRNS